MERKEEDEPMCTATKVTLMYQGNEYTFTFDWNGDYPEAAAEFMFTDGNYGCDCNRKIFLKQYCGLPEDTEESCGNEIELVSLEHISKA